MTGERGQRLGVAALTAFESIAHATMERPAIAGGQLVVQRSLNEGVREGVGVRIVEGRGDEAFRLGDP